MGDTPEHNKIQKPQSSPDPSSENVIYPKILDLFGGSPGAEYQDNYGD